MSKSYTIIMTGATSGIGLAVAKKLLKQSGVKLIVGARSPGSAKALNALGKKGNLTVLPLDLADMSAVASFAKDVQSHLGNDKKIVRLICNAGLQIITPKRMTKDGVEETFATNHLGHFLLTNLLLQDMAEDSRVVSTASGTHDPEEPLAARFGFRGAVFKNARAVSLGDVGEERTVAEQGMDRYVTSKLCNILFIREMARRVPASRTQFFSFDPGMMPGTGLARERPAAVQGIVKYIVPLFRPFVRSMSSVERSASTLVNLIKSPKVEFQSGDYIEFTGGHAPESDAASDLDLARDLYEVSSKLIQPYIND